jgi:hypothetical protein
MNALLAVKLLKPSIKADHSDCLSELAQLFDNRERYMQQSAETKAGARAELPVRDMAPLLGNEWRPA